MAQQLNAIGISAPGGQGLNTEQSPFQGGTEFALRADNAVVDRIGRLTSREAFADFISNVDFDEPSYDVVRMCRLETGAIIKESEVAEWGMGQFGLTEWGGREASESVAEDMTFGLMGVGYQGIKGRAEWGVAQWAKDEWGGVLNTAAPTLVTEYDRYVGFKIEGNQLVSIPEIAPKYGVANAQLVPFKDSIYIFSKGEPVMVYDGEKAEPLHEKDNYFPPQANDITIDDKPGYEPWLDANGNQKEDVDNNPYYIKREIIAEYINGDVACAAYGRLWVSGVNDDYNTIYYSDLLVPEQWYDGSNIMTDTQNTAGIIDVAEYWPNGGDKIQGIAAHNGFLIVFGRYSVLIYSGAQGDPAGEGGLKLEDAIRDVGLVNQDAMCNIGTDHLFVDSLGVRSLGRVIQEKSTPIAEPSMNVATVIRELIDQQRDGVRMFHLAAKNLAVCLFPETRESYVFQLGQPSSTGGLKATHWTQCDFYDGITVRTSVKDLCLLAGRDNRGVTRYFGYTQPTAYTFSYESTALNFTGNIMQTVIPKSVSYSFQSMTADNIHATWGFGAPLNYKRALRAKPDNNISDTFYTTTTSLNGSGEMLRIGFEAYIKGNKLSMQQISINTLVGRLIA